MRLWAISDLHVGHAANRQALLALEPRPGDWLAVVGDVGETAAHVEWALDALGRKFARVLWTPGNHELWSSRDEGAGGEAKYRRLVDLCRARGVATPEDPYPLWPESPPGAPIVIAPLFVLYDYTFAPDDVDPAGAVAWAAASGVVCADEAYLDPAPYPSRSAWCRARCAITEERLGALPSGTRTVLFEPLPASTRARRPAAHPAIPGLVWHATDRRLAHPIPRGRRGVGASSYPLDAAPRRRAVRRGLPRVSLAVGRRAGGRDLPAADPSGALTSR